MRKIRNQKLNVLALENRLTPAVTASLSAGSLTVTGDANSNTVLVSGTAGAYKVYAVAGDQYLAYQTNPAAFLAANEVIGNQVGGTFNVTANMNITMQNKDDTVIVTVDNGGVLPAGVNGGCSVTLNGGNDNVIVQSRDTIATAAGVINLKGGAGADNMFIFGLDVAGAIAIDGGTSGYRPGAISNPAPGDVFELFASTTKGINVVNSIVGIDDQYGPSTINGNLTVNNPTVFDRGGFYVNGVPYPAGFTTYPDPSGYNGLLVINGDSVVNGNVTYFGSGDTDGTYIQGTVNGNVSVNGGTTTSTGANDFVLAGKVTGFYTAAGADGVDLASLLSGSYVGGPAQFNFRAGDNLYDLDHTFTVAATAPAGVGMTITASTGNDDVDRISGNIGHAGVASNQVYNLGDGDNSLIWNGTYLGSTTGRFDYTGGIGVDVLQMFNPSPFVFNAVMGANNDTIFLAVNFTGTTSIRVDGGLGNDTYTGPPAGPGVVLISVNP